MIRHLLVAAALTLSAPACADPLRDALDASDHGDFETAAQLFRPLAEEGDSVAEFNLGILYANGRGVEQNEGEALRWYKLAGAQHHAGALFNLGLAYAQGQSTPRDIIRAYALFDLISQPPEILAPRAERARDALAKAMTPIGVAQAKEMTERCQADIEACL